MAKFITNQNIEIQLELASLGDRILAFLIDAAIILSYLFLMMALNASPGSNRAFIIFLMLPVMFYSLAFELIMEGQSPGKSARNIKVVKLDGGSAGLGNYLLRWIFRPLDILFYGAVAMISIIVSKNGQRLGDLAAGTTVIRLRTSNKLEDIDLINKDEDYVLQFPQVKRLSAKQAEVIRNTIRVGEDGFNDQAVSELTIKVKETLQIDTDLPDVKFLYTVLSDYEHLD